MIFPPCGVKHDHKVEKPCWHYSLMLRTWLKISVISVVTPECLYRGLYRESSHQHVFIHWIADPSPPKACIGGSQWYFFVCISLLKSQNIMNNWVRPVNISIWGRWNIAFKHSKSMTHVMHCFRFLDSRLKDHGNNGARNTVNNAG